MRKTILHHPPSEVDLGWRQGNAFPVSDGGALVIGEDHVADACVAPADRELAFTRKARVQPVEGRLEDRMRAAAQLPADICRVELELPRQARSFSFWQQPVALSVLPLDAMDLRHRLEPALDEPAALGRRRRLRNEAGGNVRRYVGWHLPVDIAHDEEGPAQRLRTLFVADQGRERD